MNQKDKKRKVSHCDCETCKSACEHKPGWFLPNQVESIIKLFEKPLKDLLGHELVIDYRYEDDTLILSPNIVGNEDMVFPFEPHGTCVFFADGKCSIYPLRPYECQVAHHDLSHEEAFETHDIVADAWSTSKILKEFDVEIPEPTNNDMWGILADFGVAPTDNYEEMSSYEHLLTVNHDITIADKAKAALEANKMPLFFDLLSQLLPEGLICEGIEIHKRRHIRLQLLKTHGELPAGQANLSEETQRFFDDINEVLYDKFMGDRDEVEAVPSLLCPISSDVEDDIFYLKRK